MENVTRMHTTRLHFRTICSTELLAQSERKRLRNDTAKNTKKIVLKIAKI